MSSLVGVRAYCQQWPETMLQDQHPAWLVLHARPRCDAKLARWLAAADIPGCWFVEERMRRYAKKKDLVATQNPLLQGYVFAAAGMPQRAACYDSGLVVHAASAPAEELQADLQALAELCAHHTGPVTFRAELQPGQTVTIEAGIFAGYRGVIVRRQGVAELVVNLPVLGSSVAVALDADLVVHQPDNAPR